MDVVLPSGVTKEGKQAVPPGASCQPTELRQPPGLKTW